MWGHTTVTWLEDLIEVYNELGGKARYEEVYELTRTKRLAKGASWTPASRATIRRTVEDHAASSANFRGKAVFYSVNGHGLGTWGLLPAYLQGDKPAQADSRPAYREGLEGIVREEQYLSRSRDPRLAESRKLLDDYTCQACGFRLEVSSQAFVIDVHHKHPLGNLSNVTVSTVDDLVCLCPTCHRIAHTRQETPLEIEEIRRLYFLGTAQRP